MANFVIDKYKLDITPQGNYPVVYLSQYEDGRDVSFYMLNRGIPLDIPSEGISVFVSGLKSNGGYFEHTCDIVDSNTVIVHVDSDMTDVSGRGVATLTFTDLDDKKVISAKFVTNVQEGVSDGGIEIPTEAETIFQQLLDEIRQEAAKLDLDMDEIDANIERFKQDVSTDVSAFKEDVTSDVDSFKSDVNDTVDAIDARMDNFIATQSGTSNGTKRTETVLYNSDILSYGNVEDYRGYFNLLDDISNYDYVEVRYSAFGKTAVKILKSSDISDGVHWSESEHDGQVIIDSSTGNRSTLRIADFHVIKVANNTVSLSAYIWGWNGASTANGKAAENFTQNWNATNNIYVPAVYSVGIYSIVGVKYEEAGTDKDAELTDIRVGVDGTIYQTAGEAVRAQIEGISEGLITIDSELSSTSENPVQNKVIDREISDLKEDLSHVDEQFLEINGVILPPPFEIGLRFLDNGADSFAVNTKRMSTKRGNYITLKEGDVVSVDTSVIYYFGGGYSTDGGSTFIPITTKTGSYTAPADGIYFFWLYKIGEAEFNTSDLAKGWEYIVFTRNGNMSETLGTTVSQVAKLNSVFMKSAVLPIPLNQWVRYSDGEVFASTATNCYIITGILPRYIKAFLMSDTDVLCAIAFFSSTTVSASNYMKSSSVDFASGTHNDGLWYETAVPDTCQAIAITTKKPSSSVADPIILFDAVSEVNREIPTEYWFEIPIGRDCTNGWIRHGTGELVPSSACECYSFVNNGITKLRVFTTSDTSVIDAVSFYSGDTISTSTYLQSSIAWSGSRPNGEWYDVTVPSGVGLIAVSVVKPSGTYSPKILFLTDEILQITDYRYPSRAEIKKAIEENDDVVLSGGWKYIYHYGMQAVADRTVVPNIPSQSIYDVRNAYNLGYKCMEANVHKTSDGKYVVTHGQNGGLGHDFDTLNGEDAAGVSISGNTLSTLQENYVYRSSNPDYRVPITTLEAFCHEAKKYNMIVMFQHVDTAELAIIKGIMGTRFFLYNGARYNYSGPILEYLTYATKAEILARCDAVGKPYIYSMGNPSSFTDEELQDIVDTLHQNGYYVATAYQAGANLQKLSAMGFDFFAVDDGYVTQEVVLDGKKLVFNLDGTVSWTAAEI